MDRSLAVATFQRYDSPANACFLPYVIGAVEAILNRYRIGNDTQQHIGGPDRANLFS